LRKLFMSEWTPRDLNEAHLSLQTDLSYDPFGLMPPASFEALPYPRVLCTPADIDRVRAGLAHHEWLQISLKRLCAAAGAGPELPAQLDSKEGVPALIMHAERCGLAHLLTGEVGYRDSAMAVLRLLARDHTRLPARKGCKYTGNSLGESHQLMHLARACDLMLGAGIEEGDKQALRTLLRANYEVIDGVPHRTCGNHNTWALASRIATAAALGDRQELHDALYGSFCPPVEGSPDTPHWRYGLVHQLRHDILSDGMHWERTAGYHFYTLMAFTEAVLTLANIGVDIWHAQLPTQMESDGYDLHRAYGPEGTKTLQAAFDAPLHLPLGGSDLSMLHDSGLANLRGIPIWGILYEAAYDVYQDSKYAWLLQYMEEQNPEREFPGLRASLQTKTGDLDFVRLRSPDYAGGSMSLANDTAISLSGRQQGGCTLLPVTGLAILRSDVIDANAPAAQIFWGPHSAGHQNPASLHLDIWAGGRMVTGTPVSGGYDDDKHGTWARTTIAHNTISIDQQRMFPYDIETASIWEADSWRGRDSEGALQLFQPDGEFKAMRAINLNVYPGTRLDRTVVVTNRYVMDVFRLMSDVEHQYDWTWHGAGHLTQSFDGVAVEAGHGAGYAHLANARAVKPIEERPTLVWDDGQGLTSGHFVPPSGAQFIVAQTPAPGLKGGKSTYGDGATCPERTSLIIRATAKQAVFVSLWSFEGEAPVIENMEGEAGTALQFDVRDGESATTWYLPFQSAGVQCGVWQPGG